MEAKTKKKVSAVAIATAVILVLAGTMAYLADASGTIRNLWDDKHVEVDIAETGITGDHGDKDYNLLPGTSETKDPTITVDTDTNAFVYMIVKDTVNSHDKDLVTYTLKETGWTELTGEDLAALKDKEIEKTLNIFSDNDNKGAKVTIDPTEDRTRVFYRVVNGTKDNYEFTYQLLEGNKVSYASTLTNDDLKVLAGLDEEERALIFQTWAIQMQPFCDADATDDDLTTGAVAAWNEDYTPIETITLSPTTLSLKVGDQPTQLTETINPDTATTQDLIWTSSDTGVATVDSNGKVTPVAAGTATITASAKNEAVSASCEVTVTAAGPTFGYAVQYKGNTDGKAVFWPAMGVNATASGVDHGGSHAGKCIHDSDVTWDYIKEHPDEFANCITNGCTKKVLLDETTAEDEFGMIATAGDGGGIVTYAPWGEPGTSGPGSQTPTYDTVLTKIKGAMTDGPSNPTMFLLSYEMLGSPTLYQPDDSRIVYNQEGSEDWWWLSDPNPNHNYVAYFVYYDGGVYDDNIVGNYYGIAPGFRY